MITSDFLSISAAICPDRDFMVFEGDRLAYEDTGDRVNRLAFALGNLGVQKGDRIGMMSTNCPAYIEVYFAAAKMGAIFVPLNFRAKSEELAYMLEAAEARILFVGERYLDMVKEMAGDLSNLENCVSIDVPYAGMLNYADLIQTDAEDEFFADVEDDDTTILMFTSGTTGRPKAVPMTHETFSAYILDNVDPADPEIEEKNVLTVPLYHVAGIQGMLAAAYGGRTLVLMRQFAVEEWMNLVQTEKANRAMLVPTMIKQVIDHPGFSDYDLASLSVITYGAAAMPFAVIKKAISLFPDVSFINAFGQTETGSTITMLGPEDHIIEGTEEEQEKKLNRLSSSIGKSLPDVEVMIIDENEEPVGPGVVGEIVAMGPRIMGGYWKDEEKTKQAFTKDGWLRTSDRGYMDEEGYIFLAGRADDLIIRGGENISPMEIENVLTSHPSVEEAAVIGVASEEWGQEPRAIVVLRSGMAATEDELIGFCRENLASFKRPRSIVFVEELPRSPLGKLSRKSLAQEYNQ